jgi:hypothetical protein
MDVSLIRRKFFFLSAASAVIDSSLFSAGWL